MKMQIKRKWYDFWRWLSYKCNAIGGPIPPHIGHTYVYEFKTSDPNTAAVGLDIKDSRILMNAYKNKVVDTVSQLNNQFDRMLIPGVYTCEVDKDGKVKFLFSHGRRKKRKSTKRSSRINKKKNTPASRAR